MRAVESRFKLDKALWIESGNDHLGHELVNDNYVMIIYCTVLVHLVSSTISLVQYYRMNCADIYTLLHKQRHYSVLKFCFWITDSLKYVKRLVIYLGETLHISIYV